MTQLPDPSYLSSLAREAGKIALDHFATTGSRPLAQKEDYSIVTAGDKAVEEFIIGRLRRDWPDHGIVGEEGTDFRRDGAAPIWVIDPIDGTSNFSAGLPYWAVSIGLIHEGRPRLGALYLPVTDELYEVDARGRALWQGEPISVARESPSAGRPTLHLTTLQHKHLRLAWPGRTLALGAVAIDICLVARGVAQAVVMRPCLWDVTAAFAILEAAGGRVGYVRGGALDYDDLLSRAHERSRFYMAAAADEKLLERVRSSTEVLVGPDDFD